MEPENDEGAQPRKRLRGDNSVATSAPPATARGASNTSESSTSGSATIASGTETGSGIARESCTVAEEIKQGPLGWEVVSLRLNREGGHHSDAMQASLVWNDIADLDLSCITPDGERIYFGHRYSECGGWLDVDMNVSCQRASKEPVENIFFASAPSGRFQFTVTNFNCHVDPKTVFIDAGRSVPFRLFLTRNGKVVSFTVVIPRLISL